MEAFPYPLTAVSLSFSLPSPPHLPLFLVLQFFLTVSSRINAWSSWERKDSLNLNNFYSINTDAYHKTLVNSVVLDELLDLTNPQFSHLKKYCTQDVTRKQMGYKV